MDYAVETFSLTKVFSDLWGRDKVYAVEDLNLQVRYNEVFGLLGPNGSGKTTTLKMLLGLLHPTKGKALVLGGDGRDPKINARIGYLPEESYLYKYLNARETLDFYGRLFSLPAKVRKLRIEELLEMAGLKAVANRPVGTFSKGMARRIGMAQALINDPDLLILDEPTTGLDPIGTRQIKDLILELAKRGKTILLCSHLLADVEDVCDRISILYGGKIQAEGKVKELLQQSHKTQITTDYIEAATIEKIKQLVQSEHNRQADIQITSPMEKLETFFIKTVVEAQQHLLRTSGAISTTQIGEFLTAEHAKEAILDKLVSAEISKRDTTESVKTKKTVPVEPPKAEPDEQLLRQLTEQNRGTKPTGVTETKKAETEGEKNEELQSDVLDQLTSRPAQQDDKQKPQSEGDSSNA